MNWLKAELKWFLFGSVALAATAGALGAPAIPVEYQLVTPPGQIIRWEIDSTGAVKYHYRIRPLTAPTRAELDDFKAARTQRGISQSRLVGEDMAERSKRRRVYVAEDGSKTFEMVVERAFYEQDDHGNWWVVNWATTTEAAFQAQTSFAAIFRTPIAYAATLLSQTDDTGTNPVINNGTTNNNVDQTISCSDVNGDVDTIDIYGISTAPAETVRMSFGGTNADADVAFSPDNVKLLKSFTFTPAITCTSGSKTIALRLPTYNNDMYFYSGTGDDYAGGELTCGQGCTAGTDLYFVIKGTVAAPAAATTPADIIFFD